MNQLKYRIWSKTEWPQKFIWWGNPFESAYFINGFLQGLDNYIFNKFIGILDKNNREIYEGDILDICGTKFEVIWKNYRYMFKSLDENGYFLGINDSTSKFVEVIGNIFEQ